MPIIIISKIPAIYQFVLHIQYLSVVSAASIPLAHCKAIFATNAFNFDCLHTVYITTKVIIIVTNAAEKRSMSTKKRLRKEPNLESFLALSISFFPFSSNIFFFLYRFTRPFSVFGALCKFQRSQLKLVKFVPGLSNFSKQEYLNLLWLCQNNLQKPNLL